MKNFKTLAVAVAFVVGLIVGQVRLDRYRSLRGVEVCGPQLIEWTSYLGDPNLRVLHTSQKPREGLQEQLDAIPGVEYSSVIGHEVSIRKARLGSWPLIEAEVEYLIESSDRALDHIETVESDTVESDPDVFHARVDLGSLDMTVLSP